MNDRPGDHPSDHPGDHPTFTELLDWLEGRLDERRGAEVADLVAHADPETAETVAWIREFLAAARAMPLRAPSPAASAALADAVRERLTPWAPGEYVDAHLVYDSRTALGAGGTRDALTGTRSTEEGVYHLVFDTEIGRVVLDVLDNPGGGVDVQGSLSQNRRNGDVLLPRVVFTSNLTVRRTARCDRSGQFKVSDLPSEVDEMWIMDAAARVRAAVRLDAGG
jgi:hypothetical protein